MLKTLVNIFERVFSSKGFDDGGKDFGAEESKGNGKVRVERREKYVPPIEGCESSRICSIQGG